MSLWVDKYRPRSLDGLTYHNGLSHNLRALASSGEFPHMLMYGPSGAGKKTRVLAVLKELYGPGVDKIKIDGRVFQAGSKKVEFNIISSTNHIEITPSDMGPNNDRLVIQDLLKEIAQTQQVDIGAKQRFKVVVINEADSLSRDAQSALRRTMEKYSPNLRLVLLANSTSNIISPIRSRCLLIRVAAPTSVQIGRVLETIVQKEKLTSGFITSDDSERAAILERIGDQCNRNLRKAILVFESLYAQNPKIDIKTVIPPADWESVIYNISKDIEAERNVAKLLSIRSTYYELLSHCIPATVILKQLAFDLVDRITNGEVNNKIIALAAEFDHRLRKGNKAIFHLEAFTARVMRELEAAGI